MEEKGEDYSKAELTSLSRNNAPTLTGSFVHHAAVWINGRPLQSEIISPSPASSIETQAYRPYRKKRTCNKENEARSIVGQVDSLRTKRNDSSSLVQQGSDNSSEHRPISLQINITGTTNNKAKELLNGF